MAFVGDIGLLRNDLEALFDDIEHTLAGEVLASDIGVTGGGPQRRRGGRKGRLGRGAGGVPRLGGGTGNLLSVDVCDCDKEYALIADVPGVDKSCINVTVDDEHHLLTIDAQLPSQEEELKGKKTKTDEGWIIHERVHGKQTRILHLPETADLQKVDVKLEHGLLKMCIGKKEHPSTGRKVQIH